MPTVFSQRQRLVTRVATAAIAGGLAAYLTATVPFYPSDWRWLVMLGTGVLWFLHPHAGTFFALLALVLPVAYQGLHLLAIYIPIAVIIGTTGPYAFLLTGLAVVVATAGLPMALTLVVPLALSLGTTARGVIAAATACLLLEIIILMAGLPSAALLPAGAMALDISIFKPALVSLVDMSWLSIALEDAKTGGARATALLRPFAEQPFPLAQAGFWAAAVAVAASVRGKSAVRFVPSHVLTVATAAAVLFVGYAVSPRLLAGPVQTVGEAALSVFIPAALVAMFGRSLANAAVALGDGYAISKSGARGGSRHSASREIPPDHWNELAGVDDLRQEITEAVASQFDAATTKSLRKFGLKPTKGVLLFGPPGTGKTKIARIIANQAGAAFYAVSGSDFASKWFGESERNLRDIFEAARQNKPAVLFFDELEAFLPKRSQMSRSDAPEKRIVATFLAETDGIDGLDGVLLVAATNHPEMIDPAALRPGRFDKLIYITPPGAAGRRAIFARYLAGKRTSPDLDLDKLASRTERFTGADIESACTSALKNAITRGGSRAATITAEDFAVVLAGIRPSVTIKMLREYEALSSQFGRRTAPGEAEAPVATAPLTWDDVAGLEEMKDALREAIEMPLTNPELLREYHVRPTKGVLLFGPPGCGKTFLAKVVASESKASFLHVKGPELLRGLVGQSEEQLRDIFIRAREGAPCVLFFDEIDAIAGARGTTDASSTQILTQMLTEMDGLEELKGVVVVAATNRPDTLDNALLRPGRFDRVLYVPPPDLEARRALLERELRGKPMAEPIDFGEFAAATEGFSASDITSFCNAAAMAAAKETLRTGQKHGVGRQLLSYCMQETPRTLTAEIIAFYEDLRERMQR